MEGYFQNFSVIPYNLNDNRTSVKFATNILSRSAFLREITDNTAVYYTYKVKDEDTPEIIADKLYGSVERNWMVLLFNQILNPYYEFPRNSKELDDYIIQKYYPNSTEDRSVLVIQATEDIHHYEKITTSIYTPNVGIPETTVTKQIVTNSIIDEETGLVDIVEFPSIPGVPAYQTTDSPLIFDKGTLTSSSYIVGVSNYDYEFSLNEQKRNIKLLDKQYVFRVEEEFRKIMTNG